jgi:hypothetical protein
MISGLGIKIDLRLCALTSATVRATAAARDVYHVGDFGEDRLLSRLPQ